MIEINIHRSLMGANGKIQLEFKANINEGELISIYGPSGSGKSSVLRMMAGLMAPGSGKIIVGRETWFDSDNKINLRPQNRNIGMVFQDYSLFPNMTVKGNLEYALQKGQTKEIVNELLHLTQLENFQNKKPALLSGGQKQRVALARALVRKPKLLLLDEPLSALDTKMRLKLQDYILEFHHRFQLTTILVSHDLNEVVKLSKRVLVLEEGAIQKDTSPENVFS